MFLFFWSLFPPPVDLVSEGYHLCSYNKTQTLVKCNASFYDVGPELLFLMMLTFFVFNFSHCIFYCIHNFEPFINIHFNIITITLKQFKRAEEYSNNGYSIYTTGVHSVHI